MAEVLSCHDDVALALQLEEVELQINLFKGKSVEDKPSDIELSFFEFQAELVRTLQTFEDMRVAQSLATALETDAPLIEQALEEEHRAENDRKIALNTTGQESGEDTAEAEAEVPQAQASYKEQENGWTLACDMEADEDFGEGPSSLHTAKGKVVLESLPSRTLSCGACREDFQPHQLVHCPCGDVYCTQCLKFLCMRVTKDELAFPPRCCNQNFPRSMIEDILSQEELSTFDMVALEFTTANRTYCARSACAKFIPPRDTMTDLLVCPYCEMKMCAHCKGGSHEGECPADTSLQAALQLAKDQGWQRCHGCNAVVELQFGCNHMT